MEATQVRALDPNREAPHMIVDRDPRADEPGHGRTLPMVGAIRPYMYDVVFDAGTRRVYADTPGGVLSAFIEGYEALHGRERALADTISQFMADGEDPTLDHVDQAATAYAATYAARYAFATTIRTQLQAEENEDAKASGAWDELTDEERQECELAAQGRIPDGVIVQVPWDNDLTGESMLLDQGIWETGHCKLVLNDGDYGINDPAGSPAPYSTLSAPDDQGREIVIVTPYPDNMIVLYPAEASELLESLERAGLVTITVRPVDLPDDLYTESVRIGAALEAGELTPAVIPEAAQAAAATDDPTDDPEGTPEGEPEGEHGHPHEPHEPHEH